MQTMDQSPRSIVTFNDDPSALRKAFWALLDPQGKFRPVTVIVQGDVREGERAVYRALGNLSTRFVLSFETAKDQSGLPEASQASSSDSDSAM